jgi:hypothetical protein
MRRQDCHGQSQGGENSNRDATGRFHKDSPEPERAKSVLTLQSQERAINGFILLWVLFLRFANLGFVHFPSGCYL